jgi:hypothetical protein
MDVMGDGFYPVLRYIFVYNIICNLLVGLHRIQHMWLGQ